MKKRLLSINELEKLLSREEYKFESPERCYVKKFEETNKWTDNQVLELFDTILEETGLPPTPDEYMERAFQLTKDYWFLDSDKGRISNSKYRNGVWSIEYLHWSEDMENAIKWRLGRMYQSLMAEYSAVCIVHTLKPKAWLLSSSQLDLALGVDLVVMDKSDNKTVYVHVTKNTGWAFEALKDKGTKTVWLRNISNKKVYWQRRFTDSHVVFVYDVEDSETTKIVNGHFVFREDYVQKEMEKVAETGVDGIKDSELQDFDRWLKKNWILLDGINGMITYKYKRK